MLICPSNPLFPKKLLDHSNRDEQDVFCLTFEIDVKDSLTGKVETMPLKVREMGEFDSLLVNLSVR